ncbi:MAG: Stp1/IreP family PP2C-type Ser/Thr phosphatase [candidate division Zixibacteria bacterium]|nr:Stp1/IreP family PP2C-type Ser/Thr phosphatase [candidate division Zixibacteria bacterium]NIT53720.1 Stp1/IreP family PP2C-type Ser/Thr phosphatase [candidate division Zixibacteria bacterium]NIW42103.1 Stp1/IreP family PP2C-type Ser/Thr phosphatase [candidate division Zixibacteria bacterium]NIX58003.1 Stp1/IreP family PP2C-type Ser/Thr phosphatase [candidate division Zixibacteria bacterium]
MKLEFAARTDVGLVRELNEDNYKLLKEKKLAVVCDGMGGHAAGEVASEIAVETIAAAIASPDDFGPPPETLQLAEGFGEEGRILVHAIRLASRRIFNQAARNKEMRGMGTTVVAAQTTDEYALIGHVGDSRVYRLRKGNLEQLTVDHSWVNELISSNQLTEEESENFVNKNVITRALGTRETVKVDIRKDRVADGDLYLLCSDGLSGFVSDSDILQTLSRDDFSLDKICKELIERANAGGGEDNITVAVLKVSDVKTPDDFSKDLVQQTVDEEAREELKIEDDILRKAFASKSENEDSRSPGEQITRPVPAYRDKTGRKSAFAWYVLSFIILAAILAYVAYAYNIGGVRPPVDRLLSRLTGSDNEMSAFESGVSGTVFIKFRNFPDSIFDHTLYVDMIPQGTVSQYTRDQLGLEPGYHILELRDDHGLVYARLNQTFKPGNLMLDLANFKQE